MKSSIFVFSLLMTSYSAAAANNDVVEGAMGFMLGGDDGWSLVSDVYKVDGCKITYVQNVNSVEVTVEFDFNKANYRSAVTKFENNQKQFSVSGDKGLQVISGVSSDGEDASSILSYWGLIPGASTTITFPMFVTEERFGNALADLRSECPGKKSKY